MPLNNSEEGSSPVNTVVSSTIITGARINSNYDTEESIETKSSIEEDIKEMNVIITIESVDPDTEPEIKMEDSPCSTSGAELQPLNQVPNTCGVDSDTAVETASISSNADNPLNVVQTPTVTKDTVINEPQEPEATEITNSAATPSSIEVGSALVSINEINKSSPDLQALTVSSDGAKESENIDSKVAEPITGSEISMDVDPNDSSHADIVDTIEESSQGPLKIPETVLETAGDIPAQIASTITNTEYFSNEIPSSMATVFETEDPLNTIINVPQETEAIEISEAPAIPSSEEGPALTSNSAVEVYVIVSSDGVNKSENIHSEFAEQNTGSEISTAVDTSYSMHVEETCQDSQQIPETTSEIAVETNEIAGSLKNNTEIADLHTDQIAEKLTNCTETVDSNADSYSEEVAIEGEMQSTSSNIDLRISKTPSTNSVDGLSTSGSYKSRKRHECEMESTSSNHDNDSLLRVISSKSVTVNNDSTIIDSDVFKRRKVDIFTEDSFPKWYNPQGKIVTSPLIPRKLPEAFSYLPIYGRPKNKADIPEFQNCKIREYIGCDLNDDEFDKLATYCSPDHLKTGQELVMPNNIPTPVMDMEVLAKDKYETDEEPASNELCIVKKNKMRIEKDPNNQYLTRLKYRGMRLMPLAPDDDLPSITSGPILQPGRDLLFRVRIYRPFLYNLKDKPNTRRHSVFSRDVMLLGRQRLSELRARLVCPNDLDLRVDVSERPDDPPGACAKDLFPSGFMFINNVFYVDEGPGCHDTSAVVRRWAERRGLGSFPRRTLSSATLDQLAIKLGHPEVYVHQGNCEHLFTFSEIRLLNATDPLRVASYPCHTAISQNHTIYCTTCAEFGAKWIVTGCTRVPFDPAFFCETCFRLYMYKDGQKIGDFKAFSYMGNEVNMLKAL